jgi:hypothetical protein
MSRNPFLVCQRSTGMRITRAGGYASWFTFAQFLALLSIFVFVFPRFGLTAPDDFSDPVKGIAALQSAPGVFTAVNLLDASFGVTALVVVLALRELLGGAAPVRMRLAVLLTSASAALFLAGGIVPIVAFPGVVQAHDHSGYRAVNGVSTGLVLAATSAVGLAVALAGWSDFAARRLPTPLRALLLIGGVVEVCEFAAPSLLIVDPLLGLLWTAWLGVTLVRLKPDTTVTPQDRPLT